MVFKKLLEPAWWMGALRNPIVLIGLVVDLLPVYAVLQWGWGATPLVLLYWTENIIAGVMTIPRIVISGAALGGIGLVAGIGLSAFFVIHYGLFCAVHGTFLMAFVSFAHNPPLENAPIFLDIPKMIEFSINSAPHVDWMLYAIIAFQLLVFFWEFIIKGDWKRSYPTAEMFAPYGRIIVMHFAIFAGAGALILLGQPMWGVLGLILVRAVFGIVNNSKTMLKAEGSEEGETAARDQFMKLLQQAKNPNQAPPS